MSQILNFEIEDAFYSLIKYGGSAWSWNNKNTEIYAGREGTSTSRYGMSKIQFTTPESLEGNGTIQLKLTKRRFAEPEFTSGLLTKKSLTGNQLYEIAAEKDEEGEEDEALQNKLEENEIIDVTQGAFLENSTNEIIYEFSNISLEPQTTYFVYLKRRIDLPNEQLAADTQGSNGFSSFYNPVYSDSYRAKSSLTFTLEEEIIFPSEEIALIPENVEVRPGESKSQTFRLAYKEDGSDYTNSTIKWSYKIFNPQGEQVENVSWFIDNGDGSYQVTEGNEKNYKIEIIATWGTGELIQSLSSTIRIIPEQWPGLTQWLSGYAIGLVTMPHPLFYREPDAYKYGEGLELPHLPSYNANDFPYICIYKKPTSQSTYIACASSSDFKSGEVFGTVTCQSDANIIYSQIISDGNWSAFQLVTQEEIGEFYPLWTNVTIKDEKYGEIAEAYTPLPIYKTEV